jgi:hypothetical protein
MLDEAAPGTEVDQRPPEVDVKDAYQVVVECRDEDQQRDVFGRLTDEGLKCRLLTL